MQDLITLLTSKAGISEEQAVKSINVIKDYVKDKFPVLAGAVDNLFGNQEGSKGQFIEKDMLD